MARTLCVVAALVMLSGAGCAKIIINESDFDRTCDGDTDCVAVQVGNVSVCGCVNGAISRSDLVAYEEEMKDVHCTGAIPPCVCEAAYCISGVCTLDMCNGN
jgi:hypothetical protein